MAVLKNVLTTENAIQKALKESLTTKFPLLGAINDVEFVKVRNKAVSSLQSLLGPGTQYNNYRFNYYRPARLPPV